MTIGELIQALDREIEKYENQPADNPTLAVFRSGLIIGLIRAKELAIGHKTEV